MNSTEVLLLRAFVMVNPDGHYKSENKSGWSIPALVDYLNNTYGCPGNEKPFNKRILYKYVGRLKNKGILHHNDYRWEIDQKALISYCEANLHDPAFADDFKEIEDYVMSRVQERLNPIAALFERMFNPMYKESDFERDIFGKK